MNRHRCLSDRASCILGVFLLLLGTGAAGCGLFEPRDPEDPTQSSLNYRPPTDPSILLANFQSAIEQKNVANYVSCFADQARGAHPFVFVPSADAAALYGPVFSNWSVAEEQSYFQNLIARSSTKAYATLSLTLQSTTVAADSIVSSYDYVLVFEHNEAGFPKTARGRLQFTLSVDASNFWTVQRWADFATTPDISWSHFKGKFSN